MGTVTVSKENYLKAILRIEREKGSVRASDIAAAMNVSRPSVSRAVHLLERENYIVIGADRNIAFTPRGLDLASSVLDRYETIYRLFRSLGVPENIASEDAGHIEHALSDDSFAQLKKLVLN